LNLVFLHRIFPPIQLRPILLNRYGIQVGLLNGVPGKRDFGDLAVLRRDSLVLIEYEVP
jgi:hypothetical protein